MEEVKTTLDELRALNVFPTNTNADFAMRDWKVALLSLQAHESDGDTATVIVAYQQAIEKFIKYYLMRARGIGGRQIEIHRLVALADMAGFELDDNERELFRNLSAFYFEGRYEQENTDGLERLLNYFDGRIRQLDELCRKLCIACQRVVKVKATKIAELHFD